VATAEVEVETTGGMEVAEEVAATILVVPGGEEEGTMDTLLTITPTQITETVEVMKIPLGVLIISLQGDVDGDGKNLINI